MFVEGISRWKPDLSAFFMVKCGTFGRLVRSSTHGRSFRDYSIMPNQNQHIGPNSQKYSGYEFS